MENQRLTEHFDLYELTKTNRVELQEKNRDVTEEQVQKLTALARLLEHIRFVLGVPLIISSGYRCSELNKAVGSNEKSQHLLCEAADFIPSKKDLGEAFRSIWKDIENNGTNVGQLIYETAERSYGITSWIHISLGVPYRKKELCGQILRMENGAYSLLS